MLGTVSQLGGVHDARVARPFCRRRPVAAVVVEADEEESGDGRGSSQGMTATIAEAQRQQDDIVRENKSCFAHSPLRTWRARWRSWRGWFEPGTCNLPQGQPETVEAVRPKEKWSVPQQRSAQRRPTDCDARRFLEWSSAAGGSRRARDARYRERRGRISGTIGQLLPVAMRVRARSVSEPKSSPETRPSAAGVSGEAAVQERREIESLDDLRDLADGEESVGKSLADRRWRNVGRFDPR